MPNFSTTDLEAIDNLWQTVPSDHVWTGWSALGDAPEEVVIYRTRAHWRKFPLRKSSANFAIFTETGELLSKFKSLDSLLTEIENLPGLSEG